MNVLLLQGPLGTFFQHLARQLQPLCQVHRIHFNAGDRYYSGIGHCVDFVASPEQWPAFINKYLVENQIDCIVLYGDCRFYHRQAIDEARKLGIKVAVLEEGYLRPDWITMEWGGVNGHSTLLDHIDLDAESEKGLSDPATIYNVIGNTFPQRLWFASIYFHAMWWQRWQFPYTAHHINASPWVQGACWIRAMYRKSFYQISDTWTFSQIKKHFDVPLFLLPLQVAGDAQIRHHSDYKSIKEVIADTMKSFADNAPQNALLLIKHHPQDRGHRQYRKLINAYAGEYGISDRVYYGHDWHLPTLLRNIRGVVTLNSTVGISALIHHLPVKVLGRAFWDVPGVTSQQELADFWQEPEWPNKKKVNALIKIIREQTQIRGSFYKHQHVLAEAIKNRILNG